MQPKLVEYFEKRVFSGDYGFSKEEAESIMDEVKTVAASLEKMDNELEYTKYLNEHYLRSHGLEEMETDSISLSYRQACERARELYTRLQDNHSHIFKVVDPYLTCIGCGLALDGSPETAERVEGAEDLLELARKVATVDGIKKELIDAHQQYTEASEDIEEASRIIAEWKGGEPEWTLALAFPVNAEGIVRDARNMSEEAYAKRWKSWTKMQELKAELEDKRREFEPTVVNIE